MGIRRPATIMKSWTKISGSTLLFAVLIGFAYGAPPLDVSEFFGTPVLSPEDAQAPPVPESKARSGSAPDLSELLALLGGDQNNALRALATMLNQGRAAADTDREATDILSLFGEPDLEKEPEDIITDATVNCRQNGISKHECEEMKQCHWLDKNPGKCIHQTERLYNALYKKLNKRGKKDIAIQVFYKSRPAKVKLPHGLYGPHIIGAFNHLHKLRPYHAPIGYNSYLNSYGYGGYNHYGYGKGYGHAYGGYGKGYGHGYGGYGHSKGAHGYGGYGHNKGGHGHNAGYGQGQGGYGYENDGDENKNDTSSNDNDEIVQDNDGYSHGNGGYGQKGGYGHGNGGYGHGNHGYGHGNGGYGHGSHGYGHGNSGYGHNGGYGHGNGDYGYGKGGYEHGNHGYGHGNGGYDHDGGYGSTYGGYGHGKDGYGGGHGYSDYSGPTYGHQGHSAGYSSGPSYGSKGYGGYE